MLSFSLPFVTSHLFFSLHAIFPVFSPLVLIFFSRFSFCILSQSGQRSASRPSLVFLDKDVNKFLLLAGSILCSVVHFRWIHFLPERKHRNFRSLDILLTVASLEDSFRGVLVIMWV